MGWKDSKSQKKQKFCYETESSKNDRKAIPMNFQQYDKLNKTRTRITWFTWQCGRKKISKLVGRHRG